MLRETPFEMAERHVRQGEERVARQKRFVAANYSEKRLAALAEDLLRGFEQTLAVQREHLRWLQSQQPLDQTAIDNISVAAR